MSWPGVGRNPGLLVCLCHDRILRPEPTVEGLIGSTF